MPQKQSILIIEDSQDLLDLLVRRFETGYGVRSANEGRAGLALAGETVPDLILLDLNLPDMSGFDVLDELKSSDKLSDVPVLIMTAVSDTESVVAGLKRGAEDYIVKPFNFAELSARIGAHLTIRQLRRRLIEMERLNVLKELAVSFNHEINNPLMAITAFAHFLRDKTYGECPECRESIDGIILEVARISDRVRQFSEATRSATVDYQPGIKMLDMENI